MTAGYNIKDILVPPVGQTSRTKGLAAYDNFARTLRDHLLKKDTVDKDAFPKSYRCLLKYWMEQDGFVLLTTIIIHGSPQLEAFIGSSL